MVKESNNAFKLDDKDFFSEDLFSGFMNELKGTSMVVNSSEWTTLSNDTSNISRPINFTESIVDPIHAIVTPKAQPKMENFVVLKKSEGTVISIESNGVFMAISREIGNSEAPTEQSEFLIDEISEEERFLLKPGAVFYWYIGYLDQLNGQRTRQSQIRFRRMPIWTKKDIQQVKDFQKQFSEFFK